MPDAIFLGIADRAGYLAVSDAYLPGWNVIGLRSVVVSYFYPLPLPEWSYGFAAPSDTLSMLRRFVLVDEREKEIGFLEITSTAEPPGDEPIPRGALRILRVDSGWTPVFLRIPQSSRIVVERPGTVDIRLGSREGSTIGKLHFLVADPPALTAERIAAIKSDPGAAKAVKLEFACRHCTSKLRIYAAIKKIKSFEEEGWISYSEIPDEFICSCGSTAFPLDILRANLHGILGQRAISRDFFKYSPLYERSSLLAVRSAFAKLLDSKSREEALQLFIADNPLLLHSFPSTRLFIKPKILTRYVADFALVTPKKEFVLIELEKASTRLLTKKGGMSAELRHAIDQVQSWLYELDEHRLAVLDTLDIRKEDIGAVRAVVIAGRDEGNDALHLRRLKAEDMGRVQLYTYDDLLLSLDSLIRGIEGL